MKQLTGKGSLIAGTLTAIGASVCCVGPLVLLGGTWVGNLTAMEPIPAHFYRTDANVFLVDFPQALPSSASLRTKHALRRFTHDQTAANDILGRCRPVARPAGRAFTDPAVLLKGTFHA